MLLTYGLLCGLRPLARWYESVIFDEDWFGPAAGSPENGYMLSEGRFANISTIYDPASAVQP